MPSSIFSSRDGLGHVEPAAGTRDVTGERDVTGARKEAAGEAGTMGAAGVSSGAVVCGTCIYHLDHDVLKLIVSHLECRQMFQARRGERRRVMVMEVSRIHFLDRQP